MGQSAQPWIDLLRGVCGGGCKTSCRSKSPPMPHPFPVSLGHPQPEAVPVVYTPSQDAAPNRTGLRDPSPKHPPPKSGPVGARRARSVDFRQTAEQAVVSWPGPEAHPCPSEPDRSGTGSAIHPCTAQHRPRPPCEASSGRSARTPIRAKPDFPSLSGPTRHLPCWRHDDQVSGRCGDLATDPLCARTGAEAGTGCGHCAESLWPDWGTLGRALEPPANWAHHTVQAHQGNNPLDL